MMLAWQKVRQSLHVLTERMNINTFVEVCVVLVCLQSGAQQLLVQACLHATYSPPATLIICIEQEAIRINLAPLRRLTLWSNVECLLDTTTHPTALTSLSYRFTDLGIASSLTISELQSGNDCAMRQQERHCSSDAGLTLELL